MPSRAASLLALSMMSAWPWANESRLRTPAAADDAIDPKSWAPLIATRARILDESPCVSDWSERNDDDAAFTPAVRPDVEAVKTADTFPIAAMIQRPCRAAYAAIFALISSSVSSRSGS